MKNYLLFICLFGAIQLGVAQVSGTVYQDLPVNGTILNTYGVKDANELGVEGVTVTSYPGGMSTTTAADGTYSLATGAGDFRIEFTWPTKTWLQSSPDAQQQNTSVQFVTAPIINVDFGLHDVSDFSETTNPSYVTNAQKNGNHVGDTDYSLYTVPYDATGKNSFYSSIDASWNGTVNNDVITMEQLGSIWGKSYQKDKKRLFVTSMLQRHVGFANSPADIYVVDYSSGLPGSLTGSFSLQGVLPSNGGAAIDLGTVNRTVGQADFELYANPGTPNYDMDAYAKVGKVSYGGCEVDHVNQKLWTINLNQKGIVGIDVSGDFASLATPTAEQYIIESLPGVPTCTGGILRPWGIKIHNGKGYLGLVCDASISNDQTDLHAYVVSFLLTNPAAGFTPVYDFALDYTRQLLNWQPWSDLYIDPSDPSVIFGNIHGVPIFSDIEFDEHENMYLAFFDRYATQLGRLNYSFVSGAGLFENPYEFGEVLKICNINGVLEMEGSSAGCPQTTIAAYPNFSIPEFFNDVGGDQNPEASLGALAILKGSNQILLTTEDPHPQSTSYNNDSNYWLTSGAHTLSTITGLIDNWYTPFPGGNVSYNGKANGLGDIELITAPAPIEIGNLVWDDTNSNGVQDAGEAGIAGVVVELQDAGGTQITTATTDANGNYIFSNDPNGTSTASHIYNVALAANTAYKLVVPTTNGGNNLTTANTGEGSNTDINDSDANTATGIADVLATDIPIIGANNHSFDFAYAPVPVGCAMAVTSATPTACNAGTNTYDLAVVVTYSTPPAGNITVTTDNGGNMSVAQTSSPQTITLTGLTSDGVAGIDVTAVFDGDAACTDTSVDAYDAPASCTVGCPPTVCGTVTVVKN